MERARPIEQAKPRAVEMRTPIEQKPDIAKNGILKGMVSKWGPVRDYLLFKIRLRIVDPTFRRRVDRKKDFP